MSGWEAVTPETKEENATMRLTVPGGWIYRYGREMLFVPQLSAAIPVSLPYPQPPFTIT